MEFIQELVLAVELSEALGVAIAVGEDELIVMPNFAALTVKEMKDLLKNCKVGRIGKLLKPALVRICEAQYVKGKIKVGNWLMQEVGKSKTRKAGGARKRKQ